MVLLANLWARRAESFPRGFCIYYCNRCGHQLLRAIAPGADDATGCPVLCGRRTDGGANLLGGAYLLPFISATPQRHHRVRVKLVGGCGGRTDRVQRLGDRFPQPIIDRAGLLRALLPRSPVEPAKTSHEYCRSVMPNLRLPRSTQRR